MAVPKRRKSHSRQGHRRSQQNKVAERHAIDCINCGEKMLPHVICGHCGWYKGREVIKDKTAEA